MAPSCLEEVTIEKDMCPPLPFQHAKRALCGPQNWAPCLQASHGSQHLGGNIPSPGVPSEVCLYPVPPTPLPGTKVLAAFRAPDPAEEGPIEESGWMGGLCVPNIKAEGQLAGRRWGFSNKEVLPDCPSDTSSEATGSMEKASSHPLCLQICLLYLQEPFR